MTPQRDQEIVAGSVVFSAPWCTISDFRTPLRAAAGSVAATRANDLPRPTDFLTSCTT